MTAIESTAVHDPEGNSIELWEPEKTGQPINASTPLLARVNSTFGELLNMMPTEMVIPMLVCQNASSEIDFCKAAFGAVEVSRRAAEDGIVLHAALRIGAAMIMVHGEVPAFASRPPQRDGSSAVVIYLYLQEVDAVIGRAIGAGARLLLPATNSSWGDRVGRIVDPEGHVWNIATRISEKNA